MLAPVLSSVAAALRQRIAAEPADGCLAPFDTAGAGALRAVDLREVRDADTSRVLVTFVVQRERCRDVALLREAGATLMQAQPEVAGVAVNFHEGDAPQILGPETLHLVGVSAAPDRLGSSVHLATFGSFVQAHRGQAARVHSMLAEALGIARANEVRGPRVLDLYGGSGAMALGLAAAGAQVRTVESFAPAVAQARAAAASQGLQLEAECDDVTTALRSAVERRERFEAVVVNPPRRGVSPQAREWMARLGPQVIAYVSCDPETLARDLDHFSRLGYATTALKPLDMIPLTDEVETVAVLRRAGVPAPRVLYEDDEILVVEKGPARADHAAGRVRGLAPRAGASPLRRGVGRGAAAARRGHERPRHVRS